MIEFIDSFQKLLDFADKSNKKIYEIAQEQEAILSEVSVETVREKTLKILNTMNTTIKEGLSSSELSQSKMVGSDVFKLKKYYEKENTTLASSYSRLLLYALATAEQNARMGKIVACPTAGACGIVPSAIIGIADEFDFSDEQKINALLTAGMIGKIVASKTALAGAVGGCQAECGVAAAMAAGAIVQLYEGNNAQIVNASTLALKNILGLVCDPIAGLVEVPCVKRNSFMTIHALTSAELALAGIESVIPADEVVDAMKQIGTLLPASLKESSQAGLATTPTGMKIAQDLNEMWNN